MINYLSCTPICRPTKKEKRTTTPCNKKHNYKLTFLCEPHTCKFTQDMQMYTCQRHHSNQPFKTSTLSTELRSSMTHSTASISYVLANWVLKPCRYVQIHARKPITLSLILIPPATSQISKPTFQSYKYPPNPALKTHPHKKS